MVFNYRQNIYICGNLRRLPDDLKKASPQTTFLVPLFVETFYKQIWNTAKQSKKDKLLKISMKVSNILLTVGIDIRRTMFSSVCEAFGGKLEYILCGGAALDEKYIKAFRTWGVEILNAYGITECSPGIAVNRNYHHKDRSAGPAIPNCELRIKGDGEILVKGDNVMLGYYNDEESTSKAFDGDWYKTGDLGYIDNDGFLYITGRKKNLIILSNGENVSPEELEEKLLSYDEVREAVVYAKDGLIVSEIYPTEEFIGNEERLKAIVKELNMHLPQYKQISKVKLRTTEFEKNSTKKILRHKVLEENKK